MFTRKIQINIRKYYQTHLISKRMTRTYHIPTYMLSNTSRKHNLKPEFIETKGLRKRCWDSNLRAWCLCKARERERGGGEEERERENVRMGVDALKAKKGGRIKEQVGSTIWCRGGTYIKDMGGLDSLTSSLYREMDSCHWSGE